jgi:hypothetical protein
MRWRFAASVAASILAAVVSPSRATSEPPVEYLVKAAYVAKFVRFAEWPDAHPIRGELAVGVVGESDFQVAMARLDGQHFGDVRISVRPLESLQTLEEVHVLVVSPAQSADQIARYLHAARDRPILTIGDGPTFARTGASSSSSSSTIWSVSRSTSTPRSERVSS